MSKEPPSKTTASSCKSTSSSSEDLKSPSQHSDEEGNPTAVTQEFQFVSYSPGKSSKSRSKSSQSLVRSKAARHQWRQDVQVRTAQRAGRGRRRKSKLQFVLVGVESSSEPSSGGDKSSHGSSISPALPPMEWLVGGARVDPFNSFPARWKPYFPLIVDHCKPRFLKIVECLDNNDRSYAYGCGHPGT